MHSAINKTTILRCTDEVWNKGNYSIIPEMIAPEYVYHHPLLGDYKGPEGFVNYVTIIHAAFPDLHITITDIVAEWDTVAIRVFFTGTNTGSMLGIPPTGRKIKIDQAVLIRFERNLAVEEFVYTDSLSLVRQLGLNVADLQKQGVLSAP
jgi:predicted ester cyclase